MDSIPARFDLVPDNVYNKVPFRTQLTESLARIMLQRQKRSAVKEHWWLAISKKKLTLCLELIRVLVRCTVRTYRNFNTTYVLITKSFFLKIIKNK